MFAALVAVIGLAVTGQLLARQLALDAADFPVLRAIGQTRAWLAAEALLRLALVTVAGGVIALAVAVAASPLMPIGPARCAEPHPGLDVDLPVLAAGFCVVALVPLVAARARRLAGAARRRGRLRRPAARGPRRTAPVRAWRPARRDRVGDPGDRGPDGIRPGPGPDRRAGAHRAGRAPPRRSAPWSAALVFGSSLIGLVATPARYGQNWEQVLDAGYADVPAQAAATLLAGIPGVAGWAAGENGELTVDGSVLGARDRGGPGRQAAPAT